MSISEQTAASGINGLDEILGGGLPQGQLYLVRGQSGAGKTTLSLQFLIEGARNGESVLYLGASETEPEIQRIARSHAWSLEGVTLHHHEPYEAEDEQTMLHPAEVELPRTIQSLLSVIEQVSPTRLVIDSLAEIAMLARDEFWYRRQLMALKRHFARGDCTVMLVELPRAGQTPVDSIVSGVIELTQTPSVYGPDHRRVRVAKIRGQEFSTGYHDYRIRTGGIEVFPRLIAAKYRRSFTIERVGTGLERLDTMLQGGLTRGTSNLLLGPSGTGKSLLAMQCIVAAAERGERSAVYVFDERILTLFQRSDGVGLPLRRLVDDGSIEIRQIDPMELTSGEFSHLAKQAVETDGVRFLLIDSLNGYAYAMPEERALTIYLHELSSYLSQQGVTLICTMAQHGLISGQIKQQFDISYVADTVILLRHFEYAARIHKAISVYKNRSGPHETAIRELQIGADGLQLGEPLTQFRGILTGTPLSSGDDLDASP